MASIAQGVPEAPQSLAWFREFLKQELAPYPGRFETVARTVLAATLVMIICMTFRIPYGYLGAVLPLFISRESTRITLQSAGTTLLASGIGAAYLLTSAWFVISVPVLHFLWIIGSFFVVFYALSAMTNYLAVIRFAFIIAVAVPLWDRHVPANINVEDTLWILLAISVGGVVTPVVELAFGRMKPGDDIILPIAERLASVEELLRFYLADRPVDPGTEKKITRFVMEDVPGLVAG